MANKPDQSDDHVVPIAERHVVMTPTGVTFVFNEEDQRRARECLERTGRLTFSFGEVTVGGLTEIRPLESSQLEPITLID
jgi:hypothetical protein